MKFAFYKGAGEGGNGKILDFLIRFWEIGPYAHCEAIIDGPDENGLYKVASSIPGNGVRITSQTLPESDWDIIESPGDVSKVLDWFNEHLDAGYDYLGILGMIFRPVKSEKTKYFCSEAIGNALGIPDAWRMDPNGLYAVLVWTQSNTIK